MRLTLDLRLEPRRDPEPGERLISIEELAGMAREPRRIAELLWGARYEEVTTVLDDMPLSVVQAGGIGLASLARARRFDGGGRPRFLLRAVVLVAAALPRELLLSRRLVRDARVAAERDWALPRHVAAAHNVLYLRADPGLRWHGQLVGGASTHTSGVINGFAANDVAISVLAAERPEWTEDVPFERVPVRRVLHLVPWLTAAAYGREIAAATAGRKPDFIYQRYALGSWSGLEAAAASNVPLVLEYNGSEIWAHKNWGTGRSVPFFDVALGIEERNLRSASLIVVVSEVLKEQLTEQGIDPGIVLVNPNGVDVERVARFRERESSHWRAEAALPEAPTVGFVGSFGLWHGVLVLPEIAQRVSELVPEARWVIVGDGPLFAQVREDIEKRGLADCVHMPGIVPHDQALGLLAAADVCVSPHVPNPDGSRFFGSPTKLFEYMGLAKPIVASDLEQIGEVIQHEKTGILTTPGDAKAAAEQVARLLGDPDARQRLGAAALESARTTYSWKAHTRRILDALAG